MSSTSPLAAHSSSPTARPSSRRLTVLVSASVACAGVGLASAGVWLDQAMLGVVGAALAAMPSLWLALRPGPSAVAASSFPDVAPAGMSWARHPVWAMPQAPHRPALLPAPVRPALTAAPTTPRVQPVAPLARSEPQTASVTEPRRFAVADRRPTAATAAASVAAPVDVRDHAPRVDTAELQLIWDLGEAGEPPTTGPPMTRRGRHVATTPVDQKPDRTPRADSPRRRARHRA